MCKFLVQVDLYKFLVQDSSLCHQHYLLTYLLTHLKRVATLLYEILMSQIKQESCAIAKMSARCTFTFLTDLHNPTIPTWFAARKSICTI